MGISEQEQAEAMKRYIREVIIPEYAKKFNKGLSAGDIKFYGKIHFSRDRSNNELNMHCHLIVSRKNQSSKKKLSPLTNHKNTKKGTVKGGFDRKNLFQQAEQRFDKLFSHKRKLTESFDYYNTMKNGNISDQLKIQERQIAVEIANIQKNKPVNKESQKVNTDLGLSSVLGLLTPDVGKEEEQIPVKRRNQNEDSDTSAIVGIINIQY